MLSFWEHICTNKLCQCSCGNNRARQLSSAHLRNCPQNVIDHNFCQHVLKTKQQWVYLFQCKSYVCSPCTVVGFKHWLYPHLNPILGTVTKVLHDAQNDIFYCQKHALEAKQSRRRGKGPQDLNVVICNCQTHDLLPVQSISLGPCMMSLLFFPEASATSSKFYLTCVCLIPWEGVPIAKHKAIHTPSLIYMYLHIHVHISITEKFLVQSLLQVTWWDPLLKAGITST